VAAETVVLGGLVIVAQLFFVLLSLIGMDIRLRRIEKRLKVLVPDPPRKHWSVDNFRDN
jgi:hypothetical protein